MAVTPSWLAISGMLLVDNPNLLCFSKTDPGSADAVARLELREIALRHAGAPRADLPGHP